MIDLSVPETKLEEMGQRYKGPVRAITMVVVVAYLLTVAGTAGWWMWTSKRTTVVSAEKERLIEQLGLQADKEAVVRQVASRVEMVENAMAAPKIGLTLVEVQTAAQAQGLDTVGLKLGEVDKVLAVTVRGASMSALEDYADGLKVKSVVKKSDGIWDQEVVWK